MIDSPLHHFSVLHETFKIANNDLKYHETYTNLYKAYHNALHQTGDNRSNPKFKIKDHIFIPHLKESGIILGRYWHHCNDKFPLTWVYLVKPDSQHEDYSFYIPEYDL